ncbi:hypothetical protein QVA66_05185 [Staphylococcus chromogenes]|nr:hypothetical protein [Staphylococcus chromogenes]
MHVIALFCGQPATTLPAFDATIEVHELPALPSQRDLSFLRDAVGRFLPHDPTPSLDEIQRQPDVKPQGAPVFAPQQPTEQVRIVVCGDDAALSAVLTRLMRLDALWPDLAFVPTGDSVAAQNWQLDASWEFALTGPVRPVPLIRDDAGVAVAGSATVTEWDGKIITGEIIVDDHTLLSPDSAYGARLVPTTNAPGLAAVRIGRRFFRPTLLADTLATGRALQAGGLNLRVTIDGVSRKRPVEKATFYRHLRDVQLVR